MKKFIGIIFLVVAISCMGPANQNRRNHSTHKKVNTKNKKTISYSNLDSSLIPSHWDPVLAGDIVMQRLIRVTAQKAKGAHDAEFVCVGDHAYIVEHDNDLQSGHSAGKAMYCVLTIVNLKTFI